MDIGEILFKRFVNWRKKKKTESEDKEAVYLEDIQTKLLFLARALSGLPIEIIPAITEGGWKGLNFYLPQKMNLYSSVEYNFKYYLFRTFYLYKQRDLGFNWNLDEGMDIESSRNASKQTSQLVLDALFKEFGNFKALHEELLKEDINSYWLYGKFMSGDVLHSKKRLDEINDLTAKSNDGEITTEIKSKPVEEMTTIQVDKEKQEEFTLQHNFEKIETAEEFDDIWRDFEGDDHLEDDLQALNDLNLKHTVRVDDVVHSIYKADFSGQLTIAESKSLKDGGFFYSYPEWSAKNRKYKKDFCRVYPLLFKSSDNNYAFEVIRSKASTIISLKKKLAHFFNASAQVKRVNQGDIFDLDQVIDMYADIHANVTPNENIYISRRKRKKDLSILFLIDLSLSGDSYVAGQRVIDIEKQAVLILGEVFSEFNIDFQVDGFFSKTRNFCSYITLKHFKDRWQRSISNIGSVAPQGFTRIGPAIRHSGYILSKHEAKSKWVVLLSDGKPNDYDQYEGRYGIEDIKKALAELRQNNVESYAVAIEEQARYYLPQMFGANHYSILANPDDLPSTVMQLYKKISLSR